MTNCELKMKRHLLGFTALVLTMLGVGARPAQAASISITPSPANVVVGQTFLLDVVMTGVTDLYYYGFGLTFDPAILQANDVLDGGFLTSGGGTSTFSPGGSFGPPEPFFAIDNTAGLVSILDALEFGPSSSGTGILASVSFTAVGVGATGIGIGNAVFLDSAGAPLDATLTDGLLQANEVPEPATLLLIGAGFAAARSRARRRLAGTGGPDSGRDRL